MPKVKFVPKVKVEWYEKWRKENWDRKLEKLRIKRELRLKRLEAEKEVKRKIRIEKKQVENENRLKLLELEKNKKQKALQNKNDLSFPPRVRTNKILNSLNRLNSAAEIEEVKNLLQERKIVRTQRSLSADKNHFNKEIRRIERRIYRIINREKVNQRKISYKIRHKEKISEYSRLHKKKNRAVYNQYNMKRKRMKGGEFDLIKQREWENIFRKTDSKCYFCGRLADTIDHLTPLSRGGDNKLDNLVPACRSCNSSKRTKTLEEYLTYLRKKGIRIYTSNISTG